MSTLRRHALSIALSLGAIWAGFESIGCTDTNASGKITATGGGGGGSGAGGQAGSASGGASGAADSSNDGAAGLGPDGSPD
jgi:hypothetical protein